MGGQLAQECDSGFQKGLFFKSSSRSGFGGGSHDFSKLVTLPLGSLPPSSLGAEGGAVQPLCYHPAPLQGCP